MADHCIKRVSYLITYPKKTELFNKSISFFFCYTNHSDVEKGHYIFPSLLSKIKTSVLLKNIFSL